MLRSSAFSAALLAAISISSTVNVSSAAADGVYTPSIKDDISQAPINWSGVYFGVNAGYAWGDSEVDLTRSSGAIYYNDPFLPSDRRQDFEDADGFLGGVQVGINKQFGRSVIGLEADVAWTNIEDELTTGVSVQGARWDISSELETLATFRARFGFLVHDNLLVYGTAGVAWGRFDINQATTFVQPCCADGGRTGGKEDHVGYVVGAGAEYALSNNWTIKGEYLYVDLGDQDYALSGTVSPTSSTPYVETFAAEHELHILRAGLNYKF